MPAVFERPQVLATSLLVDAEKAADDAAAQPTAARENDHRPVAVRQTPVVEALKQGVEVGEIADLAAQRIAADLLLEDGAHPFERSLPGLRSAIRLRGDADHPTGVAEELRCANGRI